MRIGHPTVIGVNPFSHAQYRLFQRVFPAAG